jgi:hypothetical protein
MSYKNKAAANRDALFGGVAAGGGTTKKAPAPAPAAAAAPSNTSTSSAGSGNTTGGFGSGDVSSRLEQYKKKKAALSKNKPGGSNLSDEARQAKLQQAQEYRDKANKCMQKGFFTKPDPVAASTFYKRAADAYQQLGELHLESLYRVESANCNMQLGAWASAASDFTRAAELLVALQASENEESAGTTTDTSSSSSSSSSRSNQRRKEAAEYHRKASYAWTQMNEKSKAGKSQIQAAIALQDPNDNADSSSSSSSSSSRSSLLLSKDVLTQMEEAVESHVPDVLNVYARYRQTGRSAYLADGETMEDVTNETMELAKSQIVTTAYAHEPLQDLVYLLVKFREYASALYTAGAVSAILEADGGMSTLSLSRAYCTETILSLALGDPVLASEQFLQRHVQKTFYLSSRECKLSEDLFRAIQQRDAEALGEARNVTGSNRAAMANLHSSLQSVIQQLRTQGVASARHKQPAAGTSSSSAATTTTTTTTTTKKKPPSSAPVSSKSKGGKKDKTGAAAAAAAAQSRPKKNRDDEDDNPRSLQELVGMKTGYEEETEAGKDLNPDDLAAELDNLDFDLDDSGNGNGDDHDDSDDDSDIDLR